VIAVLVFAAGLGLAVVATPTGRWQLFALPAAITLVEAIRFSFPFGGVPLASLGIAQAGGPLIVIARVGGVILLTWFVVQVGVLFGVGAAALIWRRAAGPPLTLAIVAATTVAVVVGAVVAPQGSSTGRSLRVAAVQGGGEQGTSASEVPSGLVTERHLAATATIAADEGVDLVLWPENTIDVDTFAGSPELAAVAAEAARLDAPIAVGVTEDTADGRNFVNSQVVVDPSGEIVSSYTKVRRVPFGEYVPFRGLLEALGAPVDQIARDAVAGTEPAELELPDGTTLAVAISWEVFFPGRVREGVAAGGELIANPTNGSSYTGTIVQSQQIASSRLRAVETGRALVQTAPTGFSAFVDESGNVLQRSAISEQIVMVGDVELRAGTTWYVRLGEAPFIGAATLVVGLGWALTVRDRRDDRARDDRARCGPA